MAENENLASILVKSGLISIFTNSPTGYFSKFSNEFYFDQFCQDWPRLRDRRETDEIFKVLNWSTSMLADGTSERLRGQMLRRSYRSPRTSMELSSSETLSQGEMTSHCLWGTATPSSTTGSGRLTRAGSGLPADRRSAHSKSLLTTIRGTPTDSVST